MFTFKKCDDEGVVNYVVDRIWDDISFEGAEREQFSPDLNEGWWIEIRKDDELVGFYNVSPLTDGVLTMHPNILPEYRRRYTALITKGVAQWMQRHIPSHYTKLMADVPTNRPGAMKYADKVGMSAERVIYGMPLQEFLKHGDS